MSREVSGKERKGKRDGPGEGERVSGPRKASLVAKMEMALHGRVISKEGGTVGGQKWWRDGSMSV